MPDSFQYKNKTETCKSSAYFLFLPLIPLYFAAFSIVLFWLKITWVPSPLLPFLFPFCLAFFTESSNSWSFLAPACLAAPVLLILLLLLLLDKVSLRLTQADMSLHISYSDVAFLLTNSKNFWKRHLHVSNRQAPLWKLTSKELLGCVLPTSLFCNKPPPICTDTLNFASTEASNRWAAPRKRQQLSTGDGQTKTDSPTFYSLRQNSKRTKRAISD